MKEYEEVWKGTYGRMKFRVDETEPLDNSIARYCLKVIRERMEDFIGVSSKKFKLHLSLGDPPFGDIVTLIKDGGFEIPGGEELRGIMAYLAVELDGVLLSDLSGTKFLLVI